MTRYHYDCQHRLIKLEKYDGTIAHYKYDAFGRRIEKQVSRVQSEPADLNSNVVPFNHSAPSELATEKTTFLWQANRLIAETNHKEHYRSFVYEPGTYKPLAQLEGKGKTAGVYYYHLDHLGTPQELTNTQGKLVWAVQYRAYGNVVRTIANDIDTPLRFQGQYFDAESGLHYNRHRYYQPETGRFLTPDPIKLVGGLNNDQYVPNPVNWVDPLGLECIEGNGVNSYTTNDYRQKLNEKFGRTGNLHNDINIRQAKSTAFNFYKEQGFDEASIPSHLNGIDFNHSVEIENLNKGKKSISINPLVLHKKIIIQKIQKPHRPN